MDLNEIPLFKALTQRMSWLSERQKLLAQNVANSDTPNYRAQDLRPLSFAELVGNGQSGHLQLASTNSAHISTGGAHAGFRPETDRNTEISPSGNGVVLEDQMVKVSSTATDYQMTTELYRQHLAMLRTVLGKGP